MHDSSSSQVGRSSDIKKYPVHEIISPPFRAEFCEAFITILKHHGCSISVEKSSWRIAFPTGTCKREIFPRVESERYEITLPDGYVIGETISRLRSQSCLSFDIEDLPEDVKKEHHELLKKLMLF